MSRRVLALVPALPALLLVTLAIPRLTTPLWRDEGATWSFTSLPASEIVAATAHVDRVLAPYYLLVRAMRGLGLGIVGSRVVHTVACLATLLVVHLVARRFWTRTAAFAATTALALDAQLLVAATTIRPYALTTLLGAVATWLLVRTDGPTRRSVWAYAACACTTGLFHPFSVLLAVPHLVWQAVVDRRRLWPLVSSWTVAALVVAPLCVSGAAQREQADWIPPPTPKTVLRQLAVATGSELTGLRALAFLLVLAALGLGLLRAVRDRHRDDGWLLATLLLGSAPVVLTVVSVVVSPMTIARYFQATPLGAALLVGYGVACLQQWLERRHPRRALLAVPVMTAAVVAALVPALAAQPGPLPTIDGHPDVGAHLTRTLRVGDVLVIRQEKAETGYVYSVAHDLGDERFVADTVAGLVPGVPEYVARRVVATDDGLRTEPATGGGTRTWLLELDDDADLTAVGQGCRERTGRTSFGQSVVVPLTCRG